MSNWVKVTGELHKRGRVHPGGYRQFQGIGGQRLAASRTKQIVTVSQGFRYCRDEILYYLTRQLVQWFKRNPNTTLSAFDPKLKFTFGTKDGSPMSQRIEQATEEIMGPWGEIMTPMASPFLLRLIIGQARRNLTPIHEAALAGIKTAQSKGVLPVDDIYTSWLINGNTTMGSMGLVQLGRLQKPPSNMPSSWTQAHVAYPLDWEAVFPPAQFIKPPVR